MNLQKTNKKLLEKRAVIYTNRLCYCVYENHKPKMQENRILCKYSFEQINSCLHVGFKIKKDLIEFMKKVELTNCIVL